MTFLSANYITKTTAMFTAALVVEQYPATVQTRVRFPAGACCFFFIFQFFKVQLQTAGETVMRGHSLTVRSNQPLPQIIRSRIRGAMIKRLTKIRMLLVRFTSRSIPQSSTRITSPHSDFVAHALQCVAKTRIPADPCLYLCRLLLCNMQLHTDSGLV